MGKQRVPFKKLSTKEKIKKIQRTALLYGILFWIYATTTYYLAPHLSLFTPLVNNTHYQVIPVLPWTVLIYLTLYPHVILVYYSVRCKLTLGNLNKAYFIAVAIGTIIFIVIPISIQNPPLATNSIFEKLLVFVKANDVQQGNSFPSLHVTLSMLGPLMLFQLAFDRYTAFLLFWGTLISASTITTAQHNVIDIIGGLILAGSLAYIFANRTKKDRLKYIKDLFAKHRKKRAEKKLEKQRNNNS